MLIGEDWGRRGIWWLWGLWKGNPWGREKTELYIFNSIEISWWLKGLVGSEGDESGWTVRRCSEAMTSVCRRWQRWVKEAWLRRRWVVPFRVIGESLCIKERWGVEKSACKGPKPIHTKDNINTLNREKVKRNGKNMGLYRNLNIGTQWRTMNLFPIYHHVKERCDREGAKLEVRGKARL